MQTDWLSLHHAAGARPLRSEFPSTVLANHPIRDNNLECSRRVSDRVKVTPCDRLKLPSPWRGGDGSNGRRTRTVVSPSTECGSAEERMLGRIWCRRWSRGVSAARASSGLRANSGLIARRPALAEARSVATAASTLEVGFNGTVLYRELPRHRGLSRLRGSSQPAQTPPQRKSPSADLRSSSPGLLSGGTQCASSGYRAAMNRALILASGPACHEVRDCGVDFPTSIRETQGLASSSPSLNTRTLGDALDREKSRSSGQ